MLEYIWIWLISPLDPTVAHNLTEAVSWHGRLMTIAWGILVPLGIFIARYVKVTPKQNWPDELDNKFWWHSHLILQNAAGVAMIVGFWFVAKDGLTPTASIHNLFGSILFAFGICQIISGYMRGTKGGPTSPELAGDHYNMTKRRRHFEAFHKFLGYLVLCFGAATVLLGLQQTNALNWMWLTIVIFWVALSIAAFISEQRGFKMSSYSAIWGREHSPD